MTYRVVLQVVALGLLVVTGTGCGTLGRASAAFVGGVAATALLVQGAQGAFKADPAAAAEARRSEARVRAQVAAGPAYYPPP